MQGVLDLLVPREREACLVCLDQLVHLESQEQGEKLDHQDQHLIEVKEVNLAFQDPLVQMENLGPGEREVHREKGASPVNLVLLVLLEAEESQVLKDQQGQLVPLAGQEALGQEEKLDQEESQGQGERMAVLDPKVMFITEVLILK